CRCVGAGTASRDNAEPPHYILDAARNQIRRRSLRDVTRTLCAFLLLFVVSWPTSADDGKPLAAILLVARAELPDSNFRDSVVLVMNNIGPGPGGLILNRPTRIAVARLFPDLGRLAETGDKLYFGGPVAIASVPFLF